MSRAVEESNRRLLRARDAMDRAYPEALDVSALAAIACMSEAHFIRAFRAAFGETPHRYLQRRRVERAMYLLRRTDRSVTDVCLDVGFSSLGTFSRLLTKGMSGGQLFFTTGDARTTYAELRARGVEVTQEPAEQPYGIDFGLRDPFGNHIRVAQLREAAVAAR